MAYASIASAPLAFALALLPSLAFAGDPPTLPAEPVADPVAAAPVEPAPIDPAPAVEPVVIVPIDPALAPAATTTAPVVETSAEFPVDDYYVPPTDYQPEPEPRTSLKLSSGYFGLGIAPGMTLHRHGFHPMTRFEMEFGGTLEHRHRDLALSFGVALQMQPYYGRKAPSGGADVTSTLLLGPVYIRTGIGAVGGLPRGHVLQETLPAVGGVVGVGLSLGREPMVRIGVDYDLRVNTKLEPVHTVMVAFRFACCRKN